MYSGHGGPGGNLFAGQLKHDDAGAFLATWTRLLGKPLGVIDMGGPCNKGGYEDLANFCRHASYYVASDLPNGGYALDDWTWEKHHETQPETQYHRLLASNDTLEEALIERVELRRKRYEYSMNNQIRDQVEQANYVYSCARFNDFSEAFELFVDVTTIQTPVYDLYQLMLDYSAPPALLDRFRDVFVHGVDNRDFFEWKVTANGMISPSGAPTAAPLTPTPTVVPTPTPTPTPTPAPTTVAVVPATAELTALGATVQLSAEVRDQDSRAMAGATVSWSSSAVTVATVDAAGDVTAVGKGTATITASAGPASGSAVVTVTQTVASVVVSPSVAELTAWGETVQLTAEALDANGHAVAGAAFSWESTYALVAEVNTIGLVSGIGEGVATITASAGAASGSATVTVPPTFTLSGTVRDSRRNGPVLAGAVVRLENGKRESMVIGRDGRYRFPNVWGTVTVTAMTTPSYVAETIEVTVSADRTIDFSLKHTGTPPYQGTVFITPNLLGPADPTSLQSVTYIGRGERVIYDRRPGAVDHGQRLPIQRALRRHRS